MAGPEVSVYKAATAATPGNDGDGVASARGGAIAGASGALAPSAPLEKPRYSRGLKRVQKTNDQLVKATSRVAHAVAMGLGEYLRRSKKSSRERKDGTFKDMPLNTAYALRVSIRESSRVVTDVARMIPRKVIRRQLRLVRFFSPFRYFR